MESLQKLELFSRTFENRFIFNLFDVLLCGIIVLVVLRGWRAQTKNIPASNQFLLLLAFSCLGASFATQAISSGSFVFFRQRLTENKFEFIFHVFQASAWLLLAASTYQRAGKRQISTTTAHQSALPFLPLFLLWIGIRFADLSPKIMLSLDVANLLFIGLTLLRVYRHPLGGRKFTAGALTLIFAAASLHLASALKLGSETSLVYWNAEQFAWSFSLIACALAMGETSQNLFDKVFVRLQITFILLASVMLLVITQTEKSDYFAGIRTRADHLVEFVREHIDYLRQQNESLAAIMNQEDISKSIFGFGNLPELKVVRISVGGQMATFEVNEKGEVVSRLRDIESASPMRLDSEDYFLIRVLPLKVQPPGEVAFYGTREFLDEHIRRRIVIVFSLFTAMVALSTLMIGLVVRDASATIREQAREIGKTQEQLSQASKLAAIGELAAGVAHEINNPATTILSLSSFWAAQNGDKPIAVDHEDVTEVMTQAKRIARITTSLLEFSRPQVVETKPVALDRVIEFSLRLVADLLSANGISVEKNLPRRIPRVLGDEDSLVRAVENLLRNAIDAMPHGGVLKVHVARADESSNLVRIDISDTGTGIEKNYLNRIFDPFFSTKDVGKGTGLGLSIVHGIVKEHKGTITVESEPGLGTKFIIVLPTEE